MSPEQLNGCLSFKVDVWAFGCVLLQFCTGLRPFDDISNDVAMCMKIFKGESPLDHVLKVSPLDCDLLEEDPDLKDVLKKCFNHDYQDRFSAEDLSDHKFFEGYVTRYW